MKGGSYSQTLGSHPSKSICSSALELLSFCMIFLKFREKIEPGCKPCCASDLLCHPGPASCLSCVLAPQLVEERSGSKFCASLPQVSGISEGQWSALWSAVPKAEERGATIPILPRETGWPAGPGPAAKGKLETMSWVTGRKGRLCNFRPAPANKTLAADFELGSPPRLL